MEKKSKPLIHPEPSKAPGWRNAEEIHQQWQKCLLILSINAPLLPDMNETQVLSHWRKRRSAIASGVGIYGRGIWGVQFLMAQWFFWPLNGSNLEKVLRTQIAILWKFLVIERCKLSHCDFQYNFKSRSQRGWGLPAFSLSPWKSVYH